MYGIGTVARLAQVSVRTLRYYDEIGLLQPVWVDPDTGYRWYTAEQLHRLHRILALRDLGVRLAEIAVLLDEDLSVDQLRGILLLRRAEARERVSEEADRLTRVEARLHQMEEPTMASYDVVVKGVDPEWVVAVSEELSGLDDIESAHGRSWPTLHDALAAHGVPFTPPSIAIEEGEAPIHFTAALPVARDVHIDDGRITTKEIPGIARVAATVLRGDPNFHEGFQALIDWVSDAGEKPLGQSREVYLDCDGPRHTWVVELQVALQDRG
ncbi:MAG TPA: MerR family transcriptional regulator [Acidimicrobiales bacterium]|nr:MerR family transcriptional regulator [Acidimicrobiales bacterium]